MKKIFLVLIFLFLLFFFFWPKKPLPGQKNSNNQTKKTPVVTKPNIPKAKKENNLVFPVEDFEKRITKKPFGIYITPQNSPVQPERFSGYHTGVDVEYADITSTVPVYAVSDGEIIFSDWVSGYGMTIILKFTYNNQSLYALYGHLSLKNSPEKRTVVRGEKIAYLGENKTQDADYERKHLHFAVNRISPDLRGYVQNEEELKNWIDPIELFK